MLLWEPFLFRRHRLTLLLVLAALKVVLVCFERSLGNQWYRLSLQVKEMALRKVGGLAFWDFIDFIVRTRIPIFVLLRPFIQCKVSRPVALATLCGLLVRLCGDLRSDLCVGAVVDPACRLPGGDHSPSPHR